MEILIVEDSKTQLFLLRRMLEPAGFKIAAVTNGVEAIDWLEANGVRAVLTDVTMPEMDGYQLCAKLKNDARFEQIPVILLSSLREAEDLPSILDSGADGFIYKEFEASYFVPLLNTILKHFDKSTESNSSIRIQIGKSSTALSSRQVQGVLLSAFSTAVYFRTKLDARD